MLGDCPPSSSVHGVLITLHSPTDSSCAGKVTVPVFVMTHLPLTVPNTILGLETLDERTSIDSTPISVMLSSSWPTVPSRPSHIGLSTRLLAGALSICLSVFLLLFLGRCTATYSVLNLAAMPCQICPFGILLFCPCYRLHHSLFLVWQHRKDDSPIARFNGGKRVGSR